MDIREMKREKREVERQITGLICGFQERTGMYVAQIYLNYITMDMAECSNDKRLGPWASMDVEL